MLKIIKNTCFRIFQEKRKHSKALSTCTQVFFKVQLFLCSLAFCQHTNRFIYLKIDLLENSIQGENILKLSDRQVEQSFGPLMKECTSFLKKSFFELGDIALLLTLLAGLLTCLLINVHFSFAVLRISGVTMCYGGHHTIQQLYSTVPAAYVANLFGEPNFKLQLAYC